MKKARHRPSGHALPFEWQIVVLGGAQRRPVPRFGKTAEQKGAPSRARNELPPISWTQEMGGFFMAGNALYDVG
ncbi:hypothetical protein, partial [Collinsella aerofaciens]|uniref:hypothetical protein n=1 Tax=Collinsella aerofaciens TaxID=74426 RepID=UPI0019561F86